MSFDQFWASWPGKKNLAMNENSGIMIMSLLALRRTEALKASTFEPLNRYCASRKVETLGAFLLSKI